MNQFDTTIQSAVGYLEANMHCKKHHVEHTGSLCYLLDFYNALGETDKARKHIEHLLSLVVDTPAGKVFYPGHINPMNMSQNVIDTGAAMDAIARYVHLNRSAFTEEEHTKYRKVLSDVADSYLKKAAVEKYLTNQRLWGLTGLASYARYAQTHAYDELIRASIEKALADMTVDGFFLYMPSASEYGNFEGYDGITAFYQSRCTAFIRYALDSAGIDSSPYEQRLRQSEMALLSMYKADGTKDMRMECKRWYWQSSYEIASAGFDAYALAHSNVPESKPALHNLLFQTRKHFFDGFLHSHIGRPINFQCPIFWTAHLAWMLRIEGIGARFEAAVDVQPFTFCLEGKEIFTHTIPQKRLLVNTRWQQRNFNEGIYDNGLEGRAMWFPTVPSLPPAFLFSLRETVNHVWYALRGGYVREALLRAWHFKRELVVMLLPRYSVGYGKITELRRNENELEVAVIPATKYGTLSGTKKQLTIKL